MKSPTFKTSSRFVSRILDQTATPVYVVNNDYVITYANEALANWVGIDLEQLIGAKCVFASQAPNKATNELNAGSKLNERVQGLCPPPTFFELKANGNPTSLQGDPNQSDNGNTADSNFFVSTIDQNKKTVCRAATVSHLRDKTGQSEDLGVLVVCGDVCEAPNVDPVQCVIDPSQLHQALAQIRTREDRIYSLESLVGVSPYADRLRRQVKAAIDSDAGVLIHGPRGTGKEHLARTIHAARDQAKVSQLLPVHCSIADQQLIQQNIKDSVASRNNREAESWLLLLDVDQLGQAAQNELLGFFQLLEAPVKTIATANRSLIGLAEQGSYSQELAFLLSTLSIQLAPLSERHADVPLLAQALLERDNFLRDRQLSGFSKKAIQLISEFNWPENIDQLNRTIQSAAAQTSNSQIDEVDLPAQFTGALTAMRIGTATETSIQLDSYLAGIEQQLVQRALKQAKGNKTKAAKLLGISRPKLLRRIQFFELEPNSPDFSEIIEPTDEPNTPDSTESQS